jgi:hypothetical protein
VACQQLKSSSDHQLALTRWMGFHSGMSAIEIKTSSGTHKLDGISQWQCQQLKSSSEHQLPLTFWMGFFGGMSAIKIKVRISAGTHKLDDISQWHISN